MMVNELDKINVSELPRLKNCWACDISNGSRTLKRGGDRVAHRAPKARDF